MPNRRLLSAVIFSTSTIAALGACGSHAKLFPAVPVVVGKPVPSPPLVIVPSTDSPTAASSDPLLIARLEGGRAAILLAAGEHAVDKGALRIYAHEPILSIGASIEGRDLSDEARSHLAARYVIGLDTGDSTIATREQIAVLHRIVADDPTVNRDSGESDAAFVLRNEGIGEKSLVAIVRLDPKVRSSMLWAIPEGAQKPTLLSRHAIVNSKVRPVIATTNEYGYSRAIQGEPPLSSMAFGDSFVWARLTSPRIPHHRLPRVSHFGNEGRR